VDSTGRAYVVGRTTSTNFPTCPNAGGTTPCTSAGTPLQASNAGNNDTFISRIAQPPANPPGTPTGVSAVQAGSQTISVTWTAPSPGSGTMASYTIKTYLASTNALVSSTPITINLSCSSCTGNVASLTNGTTYYVTVFATNSNSVSGPESAHSNTVVPSSIVCAGQTGLAVCGGVPGSVGATLTGLDFSLYPTMTAYTVQDQTVKGNWHLSVAATQLACTHAASPNCPLSGDVFSAGSLLFPGPSISCQGTGTLSQNLLQNVTAPIDGTSQAIADYTGGDGSCTFTPGTAGSGNLQVKVAARAYAAVYSSTMTFTVSVGP
jgi:Fibronectin type III domain